PPPPSVEKLAPNEAAAAEPRSPALVSAAPPADEAATRGEGLGRSEPAADKADGTPSPDRIDRIDKIDKADKTDPGPTRPRPHRAGGARQGGGHPARAPEPVDDAPSASSVQAKYQELARDYSSFKKAFGPRLDAEWND